MGMPVVTVAAGGLPVVESTNGFGTPVSEAAPGRGVAVTKVISPALGLPVIFETIGIAAPIVYATLDGTATNTTLSGDKLTATHSNTTTNSGARSTANKTTGKYYFEARFNTTPLSGDPCGILRTDGTFANLVGGSVSSSISFGSGIAYSNGSQYAPVNLGTVVATDVVAYAIDLDNARCWFRRNAGNWNGQATHNPATNVGGGTIASPATGYAPAVGFTTGGSGNNVTMNFGATAYTYTPPVGFGNWTT